MSDQGHINRHQADQSVLDLLNAGIDGELSPSEAAELKVLLAGSKQACDLNDELIAITGLLDQVPEREPPGYLQGAIERQIHLPEQIEPEQIEPEQIEPEQIELEQFKPVQSKNTTHSHEHQYYEKGQSFVRSLLTAHWLRTGIALAAGVILTVSVYEMGSHPVSVEDASNMVGTVAKGHTVNQGELLSSIDLDTDTLSGRLELRNIGNLYSLDVKLNSEGDSALVVNFSDRGLEFAGASSRQDFTDAISVTNGSINIAGSGEQHFTLNFERISAVPQATSLELNFFADNTLVREAELSILRK